MSYETKIGLFAAIVIAIFIWGYKFLEGQNILTTNTELYVEYQQVNQLARSAPVFINGFQVGVVSDLYLKEEDMQTIIAVLSIDKDVKVPKNAVANIISISFIGGPGIAIEFDKPCKDPDCLSSGDYMRGHVMSMLESLIDKQELNSYVKTITENLDVAMDSLNRKLSDPDPNNLIGLTMQDLRATSANLKAATNRINSILGNNGQITAILSNLSSITDSIEASGTSIKGILDNTSAFTGQLKEIQLDTTLRNANSAILGTQQAVAELKSTLQSAQLALAEITALMGKIQNGEGTVGKLFADEGLYDQLLNTSQRINGFIDDVENRPYRYIPLKSRRKVQKYDAKDAKAGNQ